jgi:hypothetical protein
MSYRGRRLVDLGFRPADFVGLYVAPPEPTPLTPLADGETAKPLDWVKIVGHPQALVAAEPQTAISAPTSVVLTPYDAAKNVVHEPSAPFPLSKRLKDLTWGDVKVVADAGKHLDIIRLLGGPLDYRVRQAPPMPQSSPPTIASGERSIRVIPQQIAKDPDGNGGGGGGPPDPPLLGVSITSPPFTPTPHYDKAVQITVTGTVEINLVALTKLWVEVDGAGGEEVPLPLTGDTFSHPVRITTSGLHTITVHATGTTTTGVKQERGAKADVSVQVTVPPGPVAAPPIAPTVQITSPKANSTIYTDSDRAVIKVKGTVEDNGGANGLEVTVSASGSPNVDDHPTLTEGTWEQDVLLIGLFRHEIRVGCKNKDGLPAPSQSVFVTLTAQPPGTPIERRLFLVETIAITSFLGDYGIGGVLNNLSLAPGQTTEITVESYRKDEETEKTAQSILDSTASECSADFENTLSNEQNRQSKDASSDSFTLSAEAGASFGYGSAKLSLGTSSASNSSRDEMAKDLHSAIEKHASKASTNRSVTVNTENTRKVESGQTESIKRELRNINVSRVLNIAFFQMLQEHLVFIHLVDARIGYYTQDLVTDTAGGHHVEESYTEVTLPEFVELATKVLSGGATAAHQAQEDLSTMLGSIADAHGELKSLVETVAPTKDGKAQANEAYVRVDPKLRGSWKFEGSDREWTVPGILLDAMQITMRTDGIIADALLASGEALDVYSQGLQDVSIAAKQVANAREVLAQKIIEDNDTERAALFAKLFPPPPPQIVAGGAVSTGGEPPPAP